MYKDIYLTLNIAVNILNKNLTIYNFQKCIKEIYIPLYISNQNI